METYSWNASQSNIPFGFPDHLYVELTDQCNLHCRHCYMSAGSGRSEILPAEIVKSALDDFSVMGGRTVAFSGGEPLFYPELESVVVHAKGRSLSPTIITNSTMLDKAAIQKWLEMGVIFVFSLEGRHAKTHDAIRGKGHFFKVNQVLEMIESKNAQQRVIICYTPMKPNVAEFFSLVNDLVQRGFQRYYLSFLEERGREKENAKALSLSTMDKVRFMTQIMYLMSNPSFTVQIDTGHLAPFFNRLLDLAPWDGTTDPIEGTIRLTSAADVCLSAYTEGEMFILGNLHNKSLRQCILSPSLTELLTRLDNRCHSKSICAKCPYMVVCGGGSPARAYTKYRDFSHPDDYCEARKFFLDQWFQA